MPIPGIGAGLAIAAAHKLAAAGLGVTILLGGAVTADAATDGGLHLGVGHETPPGQAVAAAASENAGIDGENAGLHGEDEEHGVAPESDETHGADVRAVAQGGDAEFEAEYDNHGDAVSTVAKENHGQERAGEAKANAAAFSHDDDDEAEKGIGDDEEEEEEEEEDDDPDDDPDDEPDDD